MKRAFYNKSVLFLGAVLCLLLCAATIYVTRSRSANPAPLKDLQIISLRTGLTFPRHTRLLEGEASDGLSVWLSAKVNMSREAVPLFLQQPLLSSTKIENYSIISEQNVPSLQRQSWKISQMSLVIALNGVSVTARTNRADGVWIIVDVGSGRRCDVYLYYEG